MEFENRITKKSDLDNNDSLSSFDGHASQQNHNVYKVFYDFISEEKPSKIIEIGTALGGFTKFLKIVTNEINLKCHILSYDIHKNGWYDDMVKDGIDVRVENIFNSDYTEVQDFVKNFISSEGKVLILCDGGDKIKEFNILSNYMKVGDFIMAHDYSKTQESFKNEIYMKIWNWCEITEQDIKIPSEKNNLLDYKQEIFSKAAWVCKIKEK